MVFGDAPCTWLQGKFGEGLDGTVGQTGEGVSQVAADGDIESAAAFDHREDGRYLRPSLLAA